MPSPNIDRIDRALDILMPHQTRLLAVLTDGIAAWEHWVAWYPGVYREPSLFQRARAIHDLQIDAARRHFAGVTEVQLHVPERADHFRMMFGGGKVVVRLNKLSVDGHPCRNGTIARKTWDRQYSLWGTPLNEEPVRATLGYIMAAGALAATGITFFDGSVNHYESLVRHEESLASSRARVGSTNDNRPRGFRVFPDEQSDTVS